MLDLEALEKVMIDIYIKMGYNHLDASNRASVRLEAIRRNLITAKSIMVRALLRAQENEKKGLK